MLVDAVMTPPLRTAHATLRGSRPLTAAANQAPRAGVKRQKWVFPVQSRVLLNSITFLLWLGLKKKRKITPPPPSTAPTSLDGKDLHRRYIMIKV